MRTGLNAPLVDLLGETRAQVVDLLRAAPASVAEVAERMGLSEAAVRRHLQVLERDGLVVATIVRREGPGRPSTQYALSERARRLYPDRSAEFANELLEYLEGEYGRGALRGFLRWRQDRQAERYGAALHGLDDPSARATRLAELLSEDGFLAEVTEVEVPEGATVLQLSQGHCAISDVAAAHPEICAYEAALFQNLLGTKLSRRQTIAGGARECLCSISNPTTATTGARDVREG